LPHGGKKPGLAPLTGALDVVSSVVDSWAMQQIFLSFFIAVASLAYADDREVCNEALRDKPAAVAPMAAKATAPVGARSGRRTVRGYAVLIGAMVASAAATTFLASTLPHHLQFMSIFVGQVSVLGVAVFGAPIWEPLSSAYRKLAFGVRGPARGSSDLEGLWDRTQQSYSLNEQMSRNVLTQFKIYAQQKFYAAYAAMHTDDPNYAADQMAETAVHMRRYFGEIPPDDRSVALAVRTSFTHHVRADAAFGRLVLAKIRVLDPRMEPGFYLRAVRAWFLLGEDFAWPESNVRRSL
jgi:hypothetical protein